MKPRWVNRSRNTVLLKSSRIATPKAHKKFDFGWVSAFSFGITILTAILYGSGKAYRQAFLTSFGFDDWVMPWSFQDLVYLGAVKQVDILIKAVIFTLLGIVVFILFIAAISWIVLKLKERPINGRTQPRISEKPYQNYERLLDFVQFLIYCLGGILLFSLLALIFVARAERLGYKDAEQQLQAIKATGPKTKELQLRYAIVERLMDKRVIIEKGFVVTCSERVCGLFVPELGTEAARVIPLDNILSMRYVR